MITMILLFFSVTVCAVANSNLQNDKIALIKDLMATRDLAEHVLMNLCWSLEDKLQVYRELIRINISVSTIYPHTLRDVSGRREHIRFTIITDLTCPHEDIFQQVLDLKLLALPHFWLMFDELSRFTQITHHVPINALLVTASPDVNERTWKLITFFKITHSQKTFIQNTFGMWSAEDGVTKRPLDLIRNRSDFGGCQIRVSYVIGLNSSFALLDENRERHQDHYSRANLIYLQQMCDLLNATHIKIFRSGWGFDSLNQITEKFMSGMFGDIDNDRADLAGAATALRPYKFDYFFYPSKDIRMTMVYRIPALAYYSNLFYLPFDNTMWVASGCTFLIISIMVGIWNKLEKTISGEPLVQHNEDTFLDMVMLQIGIICQQVDNYRMKSTTGRIFIFTSLITSTLLFTAFSARIVIILQSTAKNIKNIGDLYQSGYEFRVQNASFNHFFLKKPNNHTDEYWRRIIFENKMKSDDGNFLNLDEGILKLTQVDQYYAFHCEAQGAFSYIEKLFTKEEKCFVGTVSPIYDPHPLLLAAPKRSPLLQFMLVSARRLAESGLHVREQLRFFRKKPKCEGTGKLFVSVGLSECYFAFMVFAIGILCTFVIFLLELISARFKLHKVTLKIN